MEHVHDHHSGTAFTLSAHRALDEKALRSRTAYTQSSAIVRQEQRPGGNLAKLVRAGSRGTSVGRMAVDAGGIDTVLDT